MINRKGYGSGRSLFESLMFAIPKRLTRI